MATLYLLSFILLITLFCALFAVMPNLVSCEALFSFLLDLAAMPFLLFLLRAPRA
jgi:hypothetical protein